MQIESIALILRPRSTWEGCDLGVRLLQSWLRPVFTCHLAVAVPLFALFLATYQVSAWLPVLLIWMSKPWIDRTILFALSRALFGESTTPADVLRARREIWWSRLAGTLTLRRLSMSRSFVQPILQLEGLSGAEERARVRQVTQRHRGVARAATVAFANAELAMFVSLASLQLWLSPHYYESAWAPLSMSATRDTLVSSLLYAVAVLFVEPFYVAAGFGLYLNRRVELEAWDIEQEFRRAFSA